MADVDKFSDELDKLIAETESYLDDLEQLLGGTPEKQPGTKKINNCNGDLPDDGL